MLAPLIVIFLGSFTSDEYLSLPYAPSLRWYADILDKPRFLDGFIKSLELGVVAALLATLFGTSAAIVLARRSLPDANALGLVLMLPLMIPSVIIAIALTQFFSHLRISTPYITLFVGHTIITLPYVVRTVVASLNVMPRGLEWAAANLGAAAVASRLECRASKHSSGRDRRRDFCVRRFVRHCHAVDFSPECLVCTASCSPL